MNVSKSVLTKKNDRTILWLALAFILVALLILVISFGSQQLGLSLHNLGAGFDISAAVTGIWLVLLFVLWIRRSGRFDLFEPPIWFSINVFVQVIANVWLLQRDYSPTVPWLQDRSVYQQSMPLAVLLFAVGLTALWGGYVWGYERLKINDTPVKYTIRTNVVIGVWLLGWLIGLVTTILGTSAYLGAGFGSQWANYLQFIDIITKTVTTIIILYVIRFPSGTGRTWLIVIVTIDILSSLLIGSKVFALNLVWLVMVIYYATGKLSKRWIFAGAILIILLVPVVNNYRSILEFFDRGSGVSLSGRVQALGTAVEDTVTQPLGSLLDTTSSTFQRRQGSMLQVAASVMYVHPKQTYYQGLEQLSFIMQQLIPRVIWLDKPTGRSKLFLSTTTYLGTPYETTFTALGQFADIYRTFGWLSVIIWFFVEGIFFAWLYRVGPGAKSIPGIALYIVLITQIFRYDFEVTLILIQLVQFGILLWLFIYRLVFKRQGSLSSKHPI